MIDISALEQLYSGFYIRRPVGNNAFSFEQRRQKSIYVAPLRQGDLSDLAVGERVAFSEIYDGQEFNLPGLKQFVYLPRPGQDIFIFDNHNHAFFFWMAAFAARKFAKGTLLVHVDQHSDMWRPDAYFQLGANDAVDLAEAFRYTNYQLNVGNFIRPALELDLFSDLEIIDGEVGLAYSFSRDLVLDLDVDIFATDMSYINHNYKLERIRSYLEKARVVTIATSPYFIDQEQAIAVIKELLES